MPLLLWTSVAAASFLAPVHRLPPAAAFARPPVAPLWSGGPVSPHRVARPVLSSAAADVQPSDGNGNEDALVVKAKATNSQVTASAVAVVLMLVSVKTMTDLLTNSVARPPATAMALVTELTIFPLTVLWLFVDNSLMRMRRAGAADGDDTTEQRPLHDIIGVWKTALTDRPGRLLVIGLAYALDSIFYFFVQSNVGAVTYTVLAQSKIFFTVLLLRLRGMLGQLRPAQRLGLLSLFAGANLVALKDVATGVAAANDGNRLLGIAGLLCAQAVSAIANVAYERRLREPGGDVWVRNVQLTAAISLWLGVGSLIRSVLILASGGTPPSPATLLTAFRAPWVWLVVLLKASSALLIALTIKAGGNVLYAISKPWPVVFATLATCIVLGKVPSLGFLAGIGLSIAGIALYYVGKPKDD
jgi:drug/metabolite transporter (DMT)-like permease